MPTKTPRTVQAYRAERAHTWQPFLAAWYAQFGDTPKLAAELVRALEVEPTAPLAQAYPLRGYANTDRGARVAMGTAFNTIEREQDIGAPYRLARGRYNGHMQAWHWVVREQSPQERTPAP